MPPIWKRFCFVFTKERVSLHMLRAGPLGLPSLIESFAFEIVRCRRVKRIPKGFFVKLTRRRMLWIRPQCIVLFIAREPIRAWVDRHSDAAFVTTGEYRIATFDEFRELWVKGLV